MKISIITAVYNGAANIQSALDSVASQTYKNIEHLIIDGLSTDKTPEIIRNSKNSNIKFISEPDDGIYSAINKGISMSTGDVIGILHSDDVYSQNNVLELVAKQFSVPSVDIVYGDLEYLKKDNPAIRIRKWNSGEFNEKRLKYGWMPPHPTLFVRSGVFKEVGLYDTQYQISGDYDLILRIFSRKNVNYSYLPQVLVSMQNGGKSNQSAANIYKKMKEDYAIIQHYRLGGLFTLASKNLTKVKQFF